MAELKAKYTLLHDTVIRYAICGRGDIFYHIYISFFVMGSILFFILPKAGLEAKI